MEPGTDSTKAALGIAMVRMKVAIMIACAFLGQIAKGQSSPAHPAAKRAQLSREFKSAGGDALDAIDRASGAMLKSEQSFETPALEMRRLVQKLVRVAGSRDEKKAAVAVRDYADQVEICRANLQTDRADGGERFEPCLKRLGEVRAAARVAMGLPAKGPY